MVVNKFTLMIHNKGWSVREACEYWGFSYDTYLRKRSAKRYENQLNCLINGLPKKETANDE